MRGDAAFRVEGRVIASMSKGTFQVELPNGHRLLAFCCRRDQQLCASITSGMKVTVQLTPYDLGTGRLMEKSNTI